jgi:arylsulfatase A
MRIQSPLKALLLLAIVPGLSLAAERPNIVFILADDLGWADLPCYGNSFNEAPNLDRLASQGMRFNNAYAACPVCSPTRASIQSGQYPARVGVIDFITGHWRPYEEVTVPKNRTQYLPEKITTLAESLKKAGYVTGYFGKWHLGNRKEWLPSNQGYDRSHVYAGGGFHSPRFIPPVKPSPKGRLSEVLTDFSVKFIEDNKSKPFFLFLSHYDVHVQLDGDRDIVNKYLNKEKKDRYPGNAVYAAMVEHVDRSVGRIMQRLNQLDLEQETMVIFYSDNGGLISRFDDRPLIAANSMDVYQDSPMKYIASSNAPLRAEKGTVYEGGIREPLIVRWPKKIRPGVVSEALISSVDFYPTFLELVGIDRPADQVLDGTSMLPVFAGKNDCDRAIYWHYPVYHHDVPAGAVRKGDWKLVENQVTGETKLYNLKVDISESTDLTAMYPETFQELLALLKGWQKEVGAEFPVANPDFDPERRTEWGKHPDRR